jgi:hypothetical protein
MLNTAIIQIGNSDDKLTQKHWSSFVSSVALLVGTLGEVTHFHACSEGGQEWQNACWVFEIDDKYTGDLNKRLKVIKQTYNQDSIALTIGTIQFV